MSPAGRSVGGWWLGCWKKAWVEEGSCKDPRMMVCSVCCWFAVTELKRSWVLSKRWGQALGGFRYMYI